MSSERMQDTIAIYKHRFFFFALAMSSPKDIEKTIPFTIALKQILTNEFIKRCIEHSRNTTTKHC